LALARQTGRLSVGPLQQRSVESRRRLHDVHGRAARGLNQIIAKARDRLSAETKLMAVLGYKSVLARGFAVLRDAKGQPLRGVASVSPETSLQVEMADGQLEVVAKPAKRQGQLF